MVAEVWKKVVGYEGAYEVSSLGRVRSIARLISRIGLGSQMIKPRIMRQSIDKVGRPRVGLCVNGILRTRRVHQLVAEAFIGPRPDGLVICHDDGNPAHNTPENLRYDTQRSNMADRAAHQRNSLRKRHGMAKLSESEVYEIRKDNRPLSVIAAEYNVGICTVSSIRRRNSWKYLIEEQTSNPQTDTYGKEVHTHPRPHLAYQAQG